MSDTEKRFQLRISEELYAKVEEWAAQEFRSVNAQIVKVLTEAVIRHEREGGKRSVEDAQQTPDLVAA